MIVDEIMNRLRAMQATNAYRTAHRRHRCRLMRTFGNAMFARDARQQRRCDRPGPRSARLG